jgi:hypothetical protein
VPFVYGVDTAGTNTYSYQEGFYYKIGKRVFFDIMLQVSSKDAAMSGNLRIGGLPFTAENMSNHYAACSIGRSDYLSYGTAKAIGALVALNGTYVMLYKIVDNAARGYVTAADIGNLILWVSGSYKSAT